MNDNLMNRIDSLLKNVEEQKNKVVVTGKTISFVYALLAVFVVFYTSILFIKIKESVTNDSISAAARNMITAKLLDVPAFLDDVVENRTENLVDNMIASIYDQIPTLENMAKNMICEHTGALIFQIKTDLFPQFHEIIRQNAEEIKNAAEALSDENATKELAKTIVKHISEEIDYSHGLITSEVQGKVEEITKHFEAILNKPLNELTAKELSQRKLMVDWLYLVDKEEGLDKILKTLINRTGCSWECLMQEIGVTEAIKEIQEPVIDSRNE